MFHSFLSDDIKQDSATTNAHRNRFISLLKDKKVLKKSLSKIWENTDGSAEQYISASTLYFMYQGISAPGYGKEFVDILNAVDTRYIYQLISNVQLHGSNIFDS